jgi:Rrf2 family cysteine metabolism transcriptional repressor
VFSTTFRYALVSLLELADASGFIQAGIIAKKYNLSSHYLSVVLSDLRRLGLIYSQKGKRGGYRLSTSPGLINLLDLYHSLAGSPATEQEETKTSAATSPGADAWLNAFHQRWSNELGSTSLASLQAWISTHADAGATSLQ